MIANNYYFHASCVDWRPDDVHCDGGLIDLISDRASITRRTFLAHTDPEDLHIVSESLGYARHPQQGLTMAGDWHVAYFRSKHHGRRVYGFVWSAIEYVFATNSGPQS